MDQAAHRIDAPLALGSMSLFAWSFLVFGGKDLTLAAFCSPRTLSVMPLSKSLNFAILVNPPAKLASAWGLMIAAMMLPLLIAPLRHVCDRSFARRRTRMMILVSIGYVSVWMIAGCGLEPIALTLRLAIPAPLFCLGLGAVTAMVWQITPAKQWCLNRCHRRPHLAAFGAPADHDAFIFGLTMGASCVGACWALMLLPLLVGHGYGHVFGMIGVTIFVLGERLERPSAPLWRWRGPGRAVRIAAAQAHMRLATLPWHIQYF